VRGEGVRGKWGLWRRGGEKGGLGRLREGERMTRVVFEFGWWWLSSRERVFGALRPLKGEID